MIDFDDRDAEDYDNPHAFEAQIHCTECGREYRALVTSHDPSYDSPGWYEPEPGEELCPACRTLEEIERSVTQSVRSWLASVR